MIFNRAHIVSFLALSVASVDSFAFTAPSTSGVSSSNNNSVNNCFLKVCENQHYEIKRQSVFLLRSVAEDTGSESTDEAQAEADVSAASTSEDVESDDEVTETAEEESSSSQNSNPEEDITKIAYVVNLSYDTPGYQLREMFTEYGEVQKVFVPKEKVTGKSKGIAFVTMATTEQRDLAIEKMNGVECDGRTIYVDKAKPRSEKGQSSRPDKQGGQDPNSKKLYVGNISYETTKEDIVDFFAEYGEVKDVYIPTDRDTGAPRGFAFVTMVKEEADAAIENLSGVELQGRVIDVKESLPRGQKAPPRERPNTSGNEVKLYIGNLSFDTEEDTIRQVFGEYGELIDVYQPLDRYSGRPRGFAFVTIAKDGASRAIEETDGMELDGRILRVNEAQPKGYSSNDEWDEEDGGSW